MNCAHEHFAANVEVNRLIDVNAFSADVRIECLECHEPFRFVGPPMGLLPGEPTVSADGCELRIPILPKSDPRAVAPMAGYRIERST